MGNKRGRIFDSMRVRSDHSGQGSGCWGCDCLPLPQGVSYSAVEPTATAIGLAAHETNVRDVIARMLRDNELPRGICCAVSEMPTDDVMWFHVQCEREYAKDDRRWGILLIVMSFLLPFGLLIRLLGADMLSEAPERYGRDTAVLIPLRVSQDRQPSLRRWATQRRLKTVLSSVPIYQELFREYPGARITAR